MSNEELSSPDFHIPAEHHVEVDQTPSIEQDLPVRHGLSDEQEPQVRHEPTDEEVRQAMGSAAGMLDDIKAAEASGTLDNAPSVAQEPPSVADQVAILDARGQVADAPDISDEQIWNSVTQPDNPK